MLPHAGWHAPDFEHDEIERPEAGADLGVFGGRAGVAAEEHAMARATG